MTELADTCVLYRAGTDGLRAMQHGAQAVLDAGGSATLAGRRQLHELDNQLLALNASPGGAADLLAACLFIDRLDGALWMETLSFEFPAGQPPKGRALVGCVGSGDLEVLLEPGTPGTLTIQVQTSVNGAQQRWQHLFERIFQEQTPPALNIDIHDFGATPGVVRLRLEQGFEEIGHDSTCSPNTALSNSVRASGPRPCWTPVPTVNCSTRSNASCRPGSAARAWCPRLTTG